MFSYHVGSGWFPFTTALSDKFIVTWCIFQVGSIPPRPVAESLYQDERIEFQPVLESSSCPLAQAIFFYPLHWAFGASCSCLIFAWDVIVPVCLCWELQRNLHGSGPGHFLRILESSFPSSSVSGSWWPIDVEIVDSSCAEVVSLPISLVESFCSSANALFLPSSSASRMVAEKYGGGAFFSRSVYIFTHFITRAHCCLLIDNGWGRQNAIEWTVTTSKLIHTAGVWTQLGGYITGLGFILLVEIENFKNFRINNVEFGGRRPWAKWEVCSGEIRYHWAASAAWWGLFAPARTVMLLGVLRDECVDCRGRNEYVIWKLVFMFLMRRRTMKPHFLGVVCFRFLWKNLWFNFAGSFPFSR